MVSVNLKLYTIGGKKMNGKVFFAAAVLCIGTAVFAAPHHHGHHKRNEGLELANGIVDLVLKVVAPQPTVVVAPQPAVVAPAPVVVAPPPVVVAPRPVVVAPRPVVVAPPRPRHHRPAPPPRPHNHHRGHGRR